MDFGRLDRSSLLMPLPLPLPMLMLIFDKRRVSKILCENLHIKLDENKYTENFKTNKPSPEKRRQNACFSGLSFKKIRCSVTLTHF
jgi:spore germination protein GerM